MGVKVVLSNTGRWSGLGIIGCVTSEDEWLREFLTVVQAEMKRLQDIVDDKNKHPARWGGVDGGFGHTSFHADESQALENLTTWMDETEAITNHPFVGEVVHCIRTDHTSKNRLPAIFALVEIQ